LSLFASIPAIIIPNNIPPITSIGIVTSTVSSSLRNEDQHRDIRYWTYNHDKERYGIVLVSSKVVEELDF